MKNAYLLIWGLLSLSLTQCSKIPASESIALEKCNLTGKLTGIETQQGTVYFTNEVSGIILTEYRYIIVTGSQKLPLLLCNYPAAKYPLKAKESKTLTFSAKVEVLPAETDAVSINAELTAIRF
ncbi:hypothetical protein [Pedobacter alluvionis]|uniref:Uncharacterized protein n=1 Tax=Pedobacter alluvionis TaxID=475253 RepID=A0A497YCX5_9SPHI|nr:hypothetical protein [Pedobacter alluvionis]RLJ80326.1 hypothetical protein BCL90_1081 [Pedobacter alluvionis]TFB31596.1 hypothetical protein E3V97_13500 [Pedobacter alluvionis]